MRLIVKAAPLLFVFGAMTLHADDGVPDSSSSETKVEPAQTVTAAEMRAESEKIDARLMADYRVVLRAREDVQAQKDVIKLTCINDRLVEMKAQMNQAELVKAQLDAALEDQSADPQAIYSRLVKIVEDVREVREEASGCAGAPELFDQNSTAEVNKPFLADDPTTDNPFDDVGIGRIEAPAYASPFY